MKSSKTYTVSQVSKIAGVSVKTLHHYDEKGLLVPFSHVENGYRVYEQKHLVLLQQILIYRELSFGIDEIKRLLNTNSNDLKKALYQQKQHLLQRQQSLAKMINSIEVTMDNIKYKENYDILFEDIPKEKAERWEKMSRERRGDEHVDAEIEAIGKIGEQRMKEIKTESERISKAFAKTIGQPIESELVQQITQEHYDSLNNVHHLMIKIHGDADAKQTDIGFDEYVAMANSVDEQEVAELCEFYGEGYAEHARQAMIYYAHQKLKRDGD